MRTLHNLVLAAVCAASSLTVQAQTTGGLNVLGDNHALYRLQQKHKFLLLPVEEKEENAHLRIIRNNHIVKELNCRLAIDKIDYSVPLELGDNRDSDVLIDITFPGNRRSQDQRQFRHDQPRKVSPHLSSYPLMGLDERPQWHVL